MAKDFVGDFVIEACSTIGTGDLDLSGATAGYAKFSDAILPGPCYYSITEGNNRETGIGIFDGASAIERTAITTTVVDGVYNDNNPIAITLTGTALVSATFNADSFRTLWNHTLDTTTNPHNVDSQQVSFSGGVNIISPGDLEVKNALLSLDQGALPLTGGTVSGDITIKSGIAPALILEPAIAGGFPVFALNDASGQFRGRLIFNALNGDIEINRFGATGILEATLLLEPAGNARVLPGVVPLAANDLATKEYVDLQINMLRQEIINGL